MWERNREAQRQRINQRITRITSIIQSMSSAMIIINAAWRVVGKNCTSRHTRMNEIAWKKVAVQIWSSSALSISFILYSDSSSSSATLSFLTMSVLAYGMKFTLSFLLKLRFTDTQGKVYLTSLKSSHYLLQRLYQLHKMISKMVLQGLRKVWYSASHLSSLLIPLSAISSTRISAIVRKKCIYSSFIVDWHNWLEWIHLCIIERAVRRARASSSSSLRGRRA